MAVKEGYKQTEVGVIPEDWEVGKLGSLTSKIGSGVTPTGGEKVYKKNGRPFVRSQNVLWGRMSLRDMAFIDENTHKSFDGTEIKKNDVLLNISGASIGRSVVAYKSVVGGNVNQHVCIIRPIESNIHYHYLCSFLLSEKGQKFINNFQAGGNRQGLNFIQIASIVMPIPPLPEQKAIAIALSDIDGLINSLTKLIEKKKNIKQGAMQELLTGKKRLERFSGEWVEIQLGEVGKCLRGVSFEGSADLYVTDNDNSIRLLRANNIYEATINKNDLVFVKSERVADKQIMAPNDILLCMASGSKELVGKSGLFKDNDRYVYTFGAFMGCFRTDALLANPIYIYYLTQSELYKKYIALTLSGSSINNLKPSNIETMLFSIPHYKEQTAIATILSDMDSEIDTLQLKLDKYKAIKQGMMQELLTGRIRLLEGA